jgi:striatin 1/3/4
MPGSHVPPEVTDPAISNHVFGGQQPTQQELQDAYLQLQQQKLQQQHRNNMNMVRENSVQNHQPILHSYSEPTTSLSRSNTTINHGAMPVRESRERRSPEQGQLLRNSRDEQQALFSDVPLSAEDQVESVSHSYDAYGRQVPPKEESEHSRTIEEPRTDMVDGWDFDDPPPPVDPPPEAPPHYRPDIDAFPSANLVAPKSPPRGPGSYRRKSSGARRRSVGSSDSRELAGSMKADASQFKVRFAMRGHLDVVRTVIFTGGGSPSEPEFCTASDDGAIKRWYIPSSYGNFGSLSSASSNDLDHPAYFTHRGHVGAVTSLAACPASPHFSNGGRTTGDGWIFSGGQDASVKVWERGRVDAKATLEGHKDAIWALCVLPATAGAILGERCSQYGGPERILLVAGGADGTILIWAVSAPPQLNSPHASSSRGARGSRRANSVSAGSNFPSSPQPSTASATAFNYSLVHQIIRDGDHNPAPTCISPLSPNGESFVVSYTDASVLVFDTRTGEEIVGMASQETYDGTPSTGVNAVVASTTGFDTSSSPVPGRRGSMGEDDVVHGATGSEGGFEGVIISGYEDRYIRFFDANSGVFPLQCISGSSLQY